MKKRERNPKQKALRIDRRPSASADILPVFDLELLHRGFRDSMLLAKLFRRPARYLRGPSGAAR